jgi:hypothetical protein
VTLIKQLYKMSECRELSKLDIRFYIYLQVNCKKHGFIPPFYGVAKELKVLSLSLRNSYDRLVKHELIREIRREKIYNGWGIYFEFT